MRIELHVLLKLWSQKVYIGNFSPAINNWINSNNSKKDLIMTLFDAHFRGESFDIATLMQNLKPSRNTISKYLKEGESLGILRPFARVTPASSPAQRMLAASFYF